VHVELINELSARHLPDHLEVHQHAFLWVMTNLIENVDVEFRYAWHSRNTGAIEMAWREHTMTLFSLTL
jgi:hypothetical protein